jgi:hypothetical protein
MRRLVPWKVLAGALVLAVGVVGHASAGAKKEVRGPTRGSCEISCPKSSCKIDCAGVPDSRILRVCVGQLITRFATAA